MRKTQPCDFTNFTFICMTRRTNNHFRLKQCKVISVKNDDKSWTNTYGNIYKQMSTTQWGKYWAAYASTWRFSCHAYLITYTWQPVNCELWPIRMLTSLSAAHFSIKTQAHVERLIGPTAYSLYCDVVSSVLVYTPLNKEWRIVCR